MAKDALDMLKKEHEQVKSLLEQLSDTTPRAHKTRPELLKQIKTQLEVHTLVEEEIFYPALRDAASKQDQQRLVAEAFEEHRAVDKLVMPDLEGSDPGTVEFGGRAKVLKDLVLHHAEEEEKEMFPVAKELLGSERLVELRDQMMARRQELLRKMGAAA